MRTLAGECAHLLLRRADDLETLTVDLVVSTDEAIRKWDWTTRSSPIFAFQDVVYPDWLSAEEAFLFFLGPLDPAMWDIDVPCYASLGTYNIVAVCIPSAGHLHELRDFVARFPAVQWECWELERGVVKKKGYGGIATQAPLTTSVRRSKVSHGLISAEEENCTLFAAAIAKAHRYMPSVAKDLEVFSCAFREKLESSPGDGGDNTRLSWLVNVNAALSRFTSQTFSGVSPIAATESHFWSHSLLGVGVASQALVNIRRFTEVAVGDVDWIDLVDELGACPIPLDWKPLYKRAAADASAWIDAEQLMQTALARRVANSEQLVTKEERLPLLVCFSGRDGFRSTSFSLSAPLEVISAGNAYGWTPITLSHEISHVWIHGVLSVVFPDPADKAALSHMSHVVQGTNIETVLDDLRLALYFTYTLLERERENIPVDEAVDHKPWLELVETHGQQVNETLTHILDYQFFYHQDEVRYVKSIWSSWDVIPNIKERLQSYLIRSACAMLSERISHVDAIEATLDRLDSLLRDLKGDMGQANYLDDALAILRDDRQKLVTKIQSRELLVRIAKVFLANRPIGARLDREQQQPGGVYSDLEPLKFDYQQIWNPMRFLGHFCKDRKGDRAKSLWIMTKVAFMQDANATFA